MILIALAGILAIVVVAVGLSVNLGRPAPSVIVIERHPLIGQPAPDFRLATLAGGQLALSDFRGRPVIVNFWASWCDPCREEFPLLKAARARYAGEGLEILGVIHDDGAEAASAFAESTDARWPMLLDEHDEAWRAYNGLFLPISFYIDRTGVVQAVSYGPPPAGVLDGQIAKIL